MAIDVSRPLEERFKARLRAGSYHSADDLLDDALRLLDQREAFREAVAHGVAQADRGELRDGEEVFARLEAELDKSSSE
jgi:Arc/MetJ-type ribon-helix-helix transcriptional regulator